MGGRARDAGPEKDCPPSGSDKEARRVGRNRVGGRPVHPRPGGGQRLFKPDNKPDNLKSAN